MCDNMNKNVLSIFYFFPRRGVVYEISAEDNRKVHSRLKDFKYSYIVERNGSRITVSYSTFSSSKCKRVL